MFRHASLCLIVLLALAAVSTARDFLPLPDWRFHYGDAPAAATDFDDAAWPTVRIPHDWSWEMGPRKDGAQRDKGGFRVGGIGWYRAAFELPADWSDRHVTVDFDAAYRHARVWINGHDLGMRPYGFISFQHDLTPFLVPGRNVLAVRCDNSQEPSARWYHPCGLFAPVKLVATDATSRFMRDGAFVTTPEISADSALVRIAAEIAGADGLACRVEILDPAGKSVASREIPALPRISADFTDPAPALWSPESPSLYRARLSLVRAGKSVDDVEIPFGIRTISWDRATGFSLNGRVTKLRGVCEHLAGGPVGGEWTEPLLEWKLGLLKSMGCNAIRTAHNPQIPAFYDLCDRLGILVMDEIFDGWKRKAPFDYGALDFDQWWRRDVTAWVRRDRNHPCIVIRSVGNETEGDVAKDLVALCHQLDPTRLVTSGHSGSEEMDVFGVNGNSESTTFMAGGPFDKPFVATEAPHTWQVRGFYKTKTWYRDGFPNARQKPYEIPDLTPREIFTNAFLAPANMANEKQIFLSSYDNATVRISARQNWQLARDTPWFSGHFRWTGFDYPGEAGFVHGGFPFHAFAGGALDFAGFRKDLFYFYQSQWTAAPMVHLLPHWTHPRMPAGTLIPVQAYSNAEEVELLLDGKSLGIRKPGRDWATMQCQWMVPWKSGTMTAIARSGGLEVCRTTQATAGPPAKIGIRADVSHAGFPIVTLRTLDARGRLYPYGENRIFCRTDGPATVLSFESGHPADPEPPFAATGRRAFMGLSRIFLRGGENPRETRLTVGAILGERRQLTSDLAAIAVRRIALDGSPVPADFAIHYTLDGSPPDAGSPRYTAPFPVPTTCTVRAVALENGEPALAMEETFGPKLGLHWATAEEIAAAAPAATGLEAEDAKSTNGEVSTAGDGFSGTGFLDFRSREGQVAFYQENDGPAGPATLVIRYAHTDPKRRRPMEIELNGTKIATISFPPTANWDQDWQTVEIPCQLRPGANALLLKTTGQSAPNLDRVIFR